MTVFAPHITSPKGDELFNLGKITITWDRNDPPTDDPYEATSVISYEIEYTDNYNFENTVWHTLKRRIPWTEISFEWVAGKMVKSTTVRVRIRAKNSLDGELSDWSTSSGDFSINVFKLIPPAIVSPLPNHIYTDFILVILDESITRNTFNQKVRYTLEYSSKKRDIDWTLIALDIPIGQNVIRWDLEDVPSSDDFVLRLTAKNTANSCIQTPAPTPDQISRRFVYNLKIQQPGMFFIDTIPPQTILDIESSAGITNQLTHTLNIFAEDSTTEVEQVQIRECDASGQLALGEVENLEEESTDCTSIEDLIAGPDANFGKLIGKPLGYSTKTQWTLEDKSGLRRLEALVTDSGGNTSVQDLQKTFIPIFRSASSIEDIVVTTESREVTTIVPDGDSFKVTTEPQQLFEVAYLAVEDGTYWILEPFPRLIATSNRQVLALFAFEGFVYLFTYVNSDDTLDTGTVFRDDKTQITNIYDFSSSLSITNAVAEFQEVMYIGLENGELWKFDAVTFALVTTFDNPISSLAGDNEYLYVGQSNSSQLSLYDGTTFFDSDVEA